MTDRTYLDWNATAPLREEARQAMLAALDAVGNPSSVHAEGRTARRIVEEARGHVAALVGAEPGNVVFTSGGTEANVLALTAALQISGDATPRDRLLVSTIEHPSVLAGGRFPAQLIDRIPVTERGQVDLGALRQQVIVTPRPLVSIMLANNETGVIQPVAEAAAIVHEAGGLLHADAVQAAGRIPIDIRPLQADVLTISAHKLGGPKGVGALIRCDEALHFPDPLIRGGGQERGARAGTENVAGIAGFGAAAAASARLLASDAKRMRNLRDHLEAGLRAISLDVVIFGDGHERVPNTSLFAMPGIKAETALIALDLDGVAVSSGSACSSGKVAASHVLSAMGVDPKLAAGAIRVSVGFSSTQKDVERLLEAWNKLVRTLLRGGVGIAA
jgi:cysteine desulfurase